MKKTIILIQLCLALTSLAYTQELPDIALTDLQGNKHQLFHALEQEYIIFLNFSYADCAPCNQALPEIVAIAEDYKNKNLLIWYVSDRDTNEELDDLLVESGLDAISVGIDGGGADIISTFGDVYPFFGFPTISVICPDKSISWDIWPYTSGAPEWRSVIDNCNPNTPMETYEPFEIVSSTNDYNLVLEEARLKPMPFTGNGNLTLSLLKSTSITIDLFNTEGKLIHCLHNGYLIQGEHEISTNFVVPYSGVYWLRFSTDHTTSSQKVILLEP